MRRLLQRSCLILAAISLISCLVICVLWMSGHSMTFAFTFLGKSYIPGADDAGLVLRIEELKPASIVNLPGASISFTAQSITISTGASTVSAANLQITFPASQWHGVEWGTGYAAAGNITVPYGGGNIAGVNLRQYWLLRATYAWPIALLALLTIVLGYIGLPRKARSPGFCPICGYDLRATPHRCPECGATPGMPIQEKI